MQTAAAIRFVALLEGFKGLMVLAAGLGMLGFLHHDVGALAVRLIEHAHLNPAARYPQIFIDAAARVNDALLWTLAAGALAYASLRGVEAYGLYRERPWAEWLAAASGAIYLPFEVREWLHRPGWLPAALLLLNLGVVALMLWALRQRLRRAANAG